MSEEPTEQMRVSVYGRVHGIGFRQFVLIRARQLGLRGYVRNVAGGKPGQSEVELVAIGSRSQLDKLLELVRQGPEMAVVTTHSVEYGDFGEFSDFEIR